MSRRRWVGIAVLVPGTLTLALPGCAGSVPEETVQAGKPVASTRVPGSATPSRSSSPSPSVTANLLVLTRFGALVADWKAHHVADPHYAAGRAYNPDPQLPGYLGSDRYSGVQVSNGRVTWYRINLRDPVPLATAQQLALAELPDDARMLWTSRADGCAFTGLRSTALAATLQGDGYVLVEARRIGEDSSPETHPTNFNQLLLTAAPAAGPTDAPVC